MRQVTKRRKICRVREVEDEGIEREWMKGWIKKEGAERRKEGWGMKGVSIESGGEKSA